MPASAVAASPVAGPAAVVSAGAISGCWLATGAVSARAAAGFAAALFCAIQMLAGAAVLVGVAVAARSLRWRSRLLIGCAAAKARLFRSCSRRSDHFPVAMSGILEREENLVLAALPEKAAALTSATMGGRADQAAPRPPRATKPAALNNR